MEPDTPNPPLKKRSFKIRVENIESNIPEDDNRITENVQSELGLINPLKNVQVKKEKQPLYYESEEHKEEVAIFKKKIALEGEYEKELERFIKHDYAVGDEPPNFQKLAEKDSDSEVEDKGKKHITKNINKKRKATKELRKFSENNSRDVPLPILESVNKIVRDDWPMKQEEEEEEKLSIEQNDGEQEGNIDPIWFGDNLTPTEFTRNVQHNNAMVLSKSQLQKSGTIKGLMESEPPLSIQKFYYELQSKKADPNRKKKSHSVTERDTSSHMFHILLQTRGALFGMFATVINFLTSSSPVTGLPTQSRYLYKDRKVQPYTREYEESMMRLPIPGTTERSCCYGEACEWFFMFGAIKKPGVEFLTPEQASIRAANPDDPSSLPAAIQPCILCKRRDIYCMWCNTRNSCASIAGDYLFQDYYNITEEYDEYCLEDCIMNSTKEYQGLVLPVLKHERHMYYQKIVAGIVYYIQKYKKPQNRIIDRMGFYRGPLVR